MTNKNMNETQENEAAAKVEKPKAFFARQYQFGKKKVAFYLRMMRVSERQEALQKFNDLEYSLSAIEKEDAENEICLEVLTGFAATKEVGEELQKAFAAMTPEDGWILRDVWADYQMSHHPTTVFL